MVKQFNQNREVRVFVLILLARLCVKAAKLNFVSAEHFAHGGIILRWKSVTERTIHSCGLRGAAGGSRCLTSVLVPMHIPLKPNIICI